jgi:hypothetical protein
MQLKIEKHRSCIAVLTHEMRKMMLNKPIRKCLPMSASIEAEEANMQTYEDRLKLNLANGDRVAWKNQYFLYTDLENRDASDSEKRFPVCTAYTRMLEGISLMATTKLASTTFCTESWSSTPLVRDSTYVRKRECVGLARGIAIFGDHIPDEAIAGCETKHPMSLDGNEHAKGKGNSLCCNFAVYLSLGDGSTSVQAITSNELSICITNGLDRSGVTQFVVKIFQEDIEPIENIVNPQILSKHVLRSDMGDPDPGCKGQIPQV